jgi:hypothetical protein
MTPTKTPILTSWLRGDARRKVALFLLGGFTQKQITQAIPRGKNGIPIIDTAEPYDLLFTVSRDIEKALMAQ